MSMNDPDHIYMDLQMLNNDTSGSNPPVHLSFNETRTNPIVTKPRDYYISIVRFSVDSQSLPVFVPQIELDQSDPNRTIYTVTLSYEYSGTVYFGNEYVEYVTSNFSTPAANAPLVNQDVSTNYYYVEQYISFIRMVNTAYSDAFASLNSQVVAAGGTLPMANPPFLEWNPTNNRAILNADILGYEESLTPRINIYMNSPLFRLFSSFEAENNGFNVSNGTNYRLKVINQRDFNIFTVNSVNYVQMFQQYSVRALWSPITSLVFTCSLVPIVPTQVSPAKIYNSPQGLSSQGNNASIANILTDFIADELEFSPYLTYVPTSEYRLLDLKGDSPMNSISIQAFWKDRFGNLNPFLLDSQDCATLKIMFRKKTYGNEQDRENP